MYSVLIQNQRTSHIFKEYMPLFSDLISTGKMGCCRWVESGDTIDTALPGLRELISDKGDWRAIIVQVEGNTESQEFKTTVNNPYDFLINCTQQKKNERIGVFESSIPLVRISQMLGGVPSPELWFEEKWIEEEGKVARRTYISHIDKEDEKKYHELIKKYEFDGRAPSDLIFVTFRGMVPKAIREDINAHLKLQIEEKQADFCRRNRYSPISRFVKYDYIHEGPVILEADYFNFWICVALLVSQTIDASSLQAYRVYNIRSEIQADDLKKIFQKKVELLTTFRAYIQKEIREEINQRLNEKNPAPNYKLEVPVSSEKYVGTIKGIEKTQYELTPGSINDELNDWEQSREHAELELNNFKLFTERAIDESAELSTSYSSIPLETVKCIDKFEKRKMEGELSDLFDDIIERQNVISAVTDLVENQPSEIRDSVTHSIINRITRGIVSEIILAILIGSFLSCIPAFVFLFRYHLGGTIAIALAFIAIMLFTTVVVLIYQFVKKIAIEHNVKRYNKSLQDRAVAISKCKKLLSGFLNAIVSHKRGQRYLVDLDNKKDQMSEETLSLQSHLVYIEQMVEKIRKWSKSMFLSVNFSETPDTDSLENYSYLLYSDKLYTLNDDEEYSIPLNESGKDIVSPFVFVKKLSIEREELFEYDREID